MNAPEPVLDRLDRLLRLGERLVDALGRIEAKLGQLPSPSAGNADELWTVGDTAAFLKCSRSKVYQHSAGGRLPSIHVGGQLRFEPEVVRQWVRGGAGRQQRHSARPS